jgi:hypothetical protein
MIGVTCTGILRVRLFDRLRATVLRQAQGDGKSTPPGGMARGCNKFKGGEGGPLNRQLPVILKFYPNCGSADHAKLSGGTLNEGGR